MDDEIPMLIPVETAPMKKARVPLTIITGFLGSGKTTLLMRLLNDPLQTKKIAVILNEFGDSSGIDKSLLKDVSTDEFLELTNGCFCCSIKDSAVKAVENLVKSKKDLDYVLLETTGLADPGEIAELFWLDDDLDSDIYLDGIVTVVDAKYINGYLDTQPDSTRQIAYADKVILNKIDLVSELQIKDLRERIETINSIATIVEVQRGK